MRVRALGVVAAAATLLAAASAASQPPTSQERAAAQWVQDELRPFSSQAEFSRYMRDVRLAARSRGRWWALTERQRDGMIVVTGSRVQRRNASITNVQEPGVDEGDVVKQIDDHLIVLQDGRLFSIDTNAQGTGGLALSDRVDVYRRLPSAEERGEDWYDEILVNDDRIVVTGYSYARDVSEISVFRLTHDGRFQREGTFEITSDDYYSGRNYATRLIGDNLLIYTPLDLAKAGEERAGFPMVRRVGPAANERGPSRRLLDYRSLYGPLSPTLEPSVHSVSICPLGREMAGRDLACRTRGFIGPDAVSFYVTPTNVYFWIGPERPWSYDPSDADNCPRGHRAPVEEAESAFVYRIPVGIGEPEAMAVRGAPVDQFSFDEEGGTLRAFVRWGSERCEEHWEDPVHVSYVSLPLSRFSRFAAGAPASAYAALPPTSGPDLANRFTSTHLAYAPLHEMRYDVDRDGDRDYQTGRPAGSELVVVPLARPTEARILRLDHNVRRLEVLGAGLLVGGSSEAADRAATLSLIDVAAVPRIGSTLRLPGVTAGEGRSHAFNLLLGSDGNGIFGLPTIAETEETLRRDEDVAWSLPSDLSFFSVAGGRIGFIGRLASAMPRRSYDRDGDENMLDGEPDEDIVPGYSCEVSCVDWYGNSRPIFTGGRIFALSATELIEGRLENGRIVEVQRLDFARPGPRGR